MKKGNEIRITTWNTTKNAIINKKSLDTQFITLKLIASSTMHP